GVTIGRHGARAVQPSRIEGAHPLLHRVAILLRRAVETDDLRERAVELCDPLASRRVVEPVDVLGDEALDDLAALEPRERMVRRTGAGLTEGLPAGHRARPVAAAERLGAQELGTLDGMAGPPGERLGAAVVGDAGLGAHPG